MGLELWRPRSVRTRSNIKTVLRPNSKSAARPAILSLFIVLTAQLSAAECTVSANLATFQANNCHHCHGDDGAGAGDWNSSLPGVFRARSFVHGNFKVASCDSSVRDVIRKGGAAFGMSPLMPAHPNPPLSDADLDCLIEIVRDFNSE